ncbi:pyrroline-5-carboxylate reductase [Halolactibacillus alkaliphilus]|uniref:Pyrroline-5-carboxylate reductase n=1 Tax=Halolactibacillus alkaliphilus TaxID=442899 RepID=A0A511X4W8_9BACI|nr:pyrroline-5-carboxylate reductase [Halolactibacillus alkaliphilus]GEN57988.1 pyrroline-5-carboxylate reductase [Halolactibacillus alkaliphilus]GGN64669.1 pyrroline-5-carboxylate reductase [Halolactibacillus alkaliphilus]SFP07376.1 pyrroline-5-carboxylate reductase [Halolactibacillus alkaliphilus]
MKKIAFIGAGQMAEAIITGLLSEKRVGSDVIYATNKGNPEQLIYLEETYHIYASEDMKKVVEGSDVVILAVKPKDKTAAIHAIKPFVKNTAVIISVMAGVETKAIEELLDQDIRVIRVMPNTSAKVGLSATGLARGRFADDHAVKLATEIFESVGLVVEVNEQDLHAVTAVSGSGPAYFYYIVEAMLEEGVALGLSKEITTALVNQTIVGAAKMLETADLTPDVLRKNITSPNGTTERAIKTFDDYHVSDHVKKGVRGAYERSMELSQGNE